MARHKMLLSFLLLLNVLMLCTHGMAESEAEDITNDCLFTSNYKDTLFRLTDEKTKMHYEGRKGKPCWIEIASPQGKTIEGIYMIWADDTSPVSLEVWDEALGTFAVYDTVNQGIYLHEYLAIPETTSIRLSSTDDAGTIALCEVNLLTGGTTPSWVQAWEPPCKDADILVLVAHPDDEYLFFGGAIPFYSMERGLHVAVAYMTCKDATRYHELLNGLWTAGVHEYPYLVGLIDKSASVKMSTAYNQWDGVDHALDVVAQLLDAVNPNIVLTQDLGGEYGHGAHMAVADICLRIIRDEERHLARRPLKLYLHLWDENPIQMDWTIPMTSADGKTSLEIAASAFKCHVSQQGYSVKMKNGKPYKFEVVAGGPLDNGKFGLAYSSVGEDSGIMDFTEHVLPKMR